jgi:hypothetical protein
MCTAEPAPRCDRFAGSSTGLGSGPRLYHTCSYSILSLLSTASPACFHPRTPPSMLQTLV